MLTRQIIMLHMRNNQCKVDDLYQVCITHTKVKALVACAGLLRVRGQTFFSCKRYRVYAAALFPVVN